MPRRTFMGRAVGVHLAQDHVEDDVDFLLGMHLSDAKQLRRGGQGDGAVLAEEHRRAEDLRADLESVHDACGDEDGVVGRVAARDARNRDAALSLGEPQQHRFRHGAHGFDAPAPASGEAWNRDETGLA